jgi:O-antigen/teichoic acid export membrane protein
MRRRIIAGMGANSFGMAITIGIQLASLPLFLHYWDAATYGTWLILSAIPAYLSMADVGMVTAAGNKMTIAVGKGDITEANRIFQSAQAFMLVVCGVIGLFAVPFVIFAPLPWFTSTDIRLTLIALIVGVLAALFGGLAEAAFKSTGRYATGTFLSNYARLGEWLGSMFGLIFVGTFAGVAVAGLVVRLIGVLCSILVARRGNHGLSWGIQSAKETEIRAMIKPAVSFMAFPLANALSFQGVTLLVGAMFGPVAVAMFNTYRTIARVAVQVTAIFSHALWPEFSRIFGQGETSALTGLYRRSAWLSAIQSLFLSLVLYFLSPWLLRVWTHNAIEFVPSHMLLMLVYATVGGIWHIPRVLLMATNQHVGLAYWVLAAGALCVGFSWILGHIWQLNGVVAAMLLSELFIAVVCSRLAYVAINNKPTNNGSDMGVMLR